MPSIFSRIINGELPSAKVYEDAKTLVIMDINPKQTGQMLVLPKAEVSTVWELTDSDYQALMSSLRLAGRSLLKRFPGKKVGVMIEGLEVTDHAHVIVFPFSTAAEYQAKPDLNNPPSKEELDKLASELAF